MHPVRRQRLGVVVSIVVFSTIAVGLVAYALRGNINLFYPPAEVAAGKAPVDTQIRVGGMVVEGSVDRSDDSLEVSFLVTDFTANVGIVYDGILPDLFAEGEGVVASGQLSRSAGGGYVLMASEILAKHDENYMPPEVAEALNKDPTAALNP